MVQIETASMNEEFGNSKVYRAKACLDGRIAEKLADITDDPQNIYNCVLLPGVVWGVTCS